MLRGAWPTATSPCARRAPAPRSSMTSQRRSTRWRRTSSGCSTRAESSSPGEPRSPHAAREHPGDLEGLHDGVMAPAEALPSLEEQTRALSSLVDDLFELAQIDAGALGLELEEAPIAGAVQVSLRGVEAEARLRRIRLDSDVDDAVVARFAPSELQRVLQNLLTNALRHTPSDGSVAVRVSAGGKEVQVDVEDSGDGLGRAPAPRRRKRRWRCSRRSARPRSWRR